MVSSIILSIVFTILTLTVTVNGQICISNATQYSSCSPNSNCGCLLYSFADDMGVCGLLTASCSSFALCQSPYDDCAQSEYICVRHTQCSSNPICIPPSMFDESVCPPTIITNYSSELTVNSQTYTRDGASGSFYYEAIEIQVPTTGIYTFTTSSTIGDTYGYLYQGNFYPSYPQYNKITEDDDGAGDTQFQLTATLRSDLTYILVFTTYSAGATGSFNIVASGPADVFMNPLYIST